MVAEPGAAAGDPVDPQLRAPAHPAAGGPVDHPTGDLVEPRARDPVDARLAVAAAAAWLGAFVGTSAAPELSWVGIASAVLVCGLPIAAAVVERFVQARRRDLARVAVLTVAALAAALLIGAVRLGAVRHGGLEDWAAERATARGDGVVTGDPVRISGRTSGSHRTAGLVVVPVRMGTVEARGRLLRTRAPVTVLAHSRRWLGLLPGQRVTLSGRLGPARAGQPVAAIVAVRGPPTLVGRPPWFQRAAGSLRSGLRQASSGLPSAERGLLPGLVVGDTSRLPPQLSDDMRTAGLNHLTAVSGANITIVVGFVLFAARWVGVRGRWLPVVAAVAMAGFVILARPQPSVVRAAAMGAVGLFAMSTGRRGRSLPALAGAVLGLLLFDPWLARSFGFVLSALATAGLVLLAPGWSRALQTRGVPRPLADALAVPTAAQAVCGPVIVLLSGQVSLVAVPANLLAAPAVAPATVLGVLATAVSPLSDQLARLVAALAGLPVWWIARVATSSAALPDAAVPWPQSVTGALLLVALTVLAALAVRRLARRPAQATGAAFVLGVALVVPATNPGWPPAGWVMAACDVGQGDALVLAVSPGTAVVVDTGPDPRLVDRCLRRLDVHRVPLVVLTHLHADHVEGLSGVLSGRRVGEIGLGPYDEPAGELVRVRRWAGRAGVPLTRIEVGERMSVGPVSWRVLWPARVIDIESVPNNASIVMLVRSHGLRLLLTGDVEPPAQQAMLARVELPHVDVLKVAHHGSAYQAPRLLAEARPRLALVSVGVDNDYGHPAPSTLRALRRAGAVVGRTDRDGTLVVVGGRRHLRLVRAGG